MSESYFETKNSCMCYLLVNGFHEHTDIHSHTNQGTD